MLCSVVDLFTVGVGPSSSHTVAPMTAAAAVALRLSVHDVDAVRVTLHGSLAITARGHGTDRALIAGLGGHEPATVKPEVVSAARVRGGRVVVGGRDVHYELVLSPRGGPPGHPNALRFAAYDRQGSTVLDTTFRSTGGGFLTEDGVQTPLRAAPAVP